MSISRWVQGASLLIACASVMALPLQVGAETSSCVTCHLDEDMLTENLQVVKAKKKSSMQSGAG